MQGQRYQQHRIRTSIHSDRETVVHDSDYDCDDHHYAVSVDGFGRSSYYDEILEHLMYLY